MKAYIENKNSRWLINDKRHEHWTFEEIELMDEFLRIIKQHPIKEKQTSRLEKWCSFFKKEPAQRFEIIKKKNNFLLIRQVN